MCFVGGAPEELQLVGLEEGDDVEISAGGFGR